MMRRWMRAPVSNEVAAKAITITAMNVFEVASGIPSDARKVPPPDTKASSFAERPLAAPQLA
jgi:hypothetical protein